MLKITKLLESLVATQEKINKSIKELKEEIKPQLDKIVIDGNKIAVIDNQLTKLESNVYTKEETVKTINKEYNYRKEYEECKEENYVLLELIERYCKYDNKYKMLDVFKEINNEYLVEKR